MRMRTRSIELAPVAFTIDETAAVSTLGLSTIKAAIAKGELVAAKVNSRTVILASDLQNFLARKRVLRNGAATAPAPPPAPAPVVKRAAAGSRAPARRRRA